MRLLGTVILAILILSPMSSHVASQGTDDSCSSYLVPMLNDAGLILEASAPSLGCRMNSSGEWYMPTIGEVVETIDRAELNERSIAILEAVDRMSTDSAFASSVQFVRDDATAWVPGRGGRPHSVDVSNDEVGGQEQWLNNLRESYNQSMVMYITRTAGTETELVSYLEWFMARRDSTLSSIVQQSNPLSGSAFLSNWGYQQAPWPWQMVDSTAIEAFAGRSDPAGQANDAQSSVSVESATVNYLEFESEPTEVEGAPGQTVRFEISYPRLQGVSHVAFMAASEYSFIENIPLAWIDQTGRLACSPGHEQDRVDPADRAQMLTLEGDVLPTYLDVTVSPEATIGDDLSVCFELVGFIGTMELFSWNATAIINVVSSEG